jgi:exonuclease III
MTNTSGHSKTHANSKRVRKVHDLKFLSWNIHDVRMKDEGLKSSMDEFLDILNENDVFCLQETKDPVKIAGFRCFNSNRKSSRSGGVCIGVKNDISKGVVPLNTSCCEDIVAVRFKKDHFSTTRDFVLINVYDSPINSSYKKNGCDDSTTLDKTSEFIHRLHSNTEIILMGDLNARTGNESDFNDPHFDPLSTYQDDDLNNKVPNRSNKDQKLNSNGKPFIDFIKGNGLLILNGRKLGDVYGEMTCLKYNGCSVVDYMCTSINLFNNVNSMRVGEFTALSDHYPLKMSLRLGRLPISSAAMPCFDCAPIAYKWKNNGINTEGSSTAYVNAQDDPDILVTIKQLLDSNIICSEDVTSMNTKVTNLFNNIASKSLSRKTRKRTNKKKWFDWDCRTAKRNLNKAAKLSGKCPTNDDLRNTYHMMKKDYKCLIKSKRSEFLFGINSRIESGKHIDWKSFKSLQEYHKDEETFDTLDLYNFFVFFQDLYKKRCNKSSHSEGAYAAPNIPGDLELETLNRPFSTTEIDIGIKKLKSNKGVSLDCISNEMIKFSNKDLRSVIQLLFNKCLEFGIYPWNSSVTTPLHKKGDRENPDNYRAITLGSCLLIVTSR